MGHSALLGLQQAFQSHKKQVVRGSLGRRKVDVNRFICEHENQKSGATNVTCSHASLLSAATDNEASAANLRIRL